MKRWHAIVLDILVSAGIGLTPKYVKDSDIQKAVIAALTAVGVVATNSTSKHNPDGTKAETSWLHG